MPDPDNLLHLGPFTGPALSSSRAPANSPRIYPRGFEQQTGTSGPLPGWNDPKHRGGGLAASITGRILSPAKLPAAEVKQGAVHVRGKGPTRRSTPDMKAYKRFPEPSSQGPEMRIEDIQEARAVVFGCGTEAGAWSSLPSRSPSPLTGPTRAPQEEEVLWASSTLVDGQKMVINPGGPPMVVRPI